MRDYSSIETMEGSCQLVRRVSDLFSPKYIAHDLVFGWSVCLFFTLLNHSFLSSRQPDCFKIISLNLLLRLFNSRMYVYILFLLFFNEVFKSFLSGN